MKCPHCGNESRKKYVCSKCGGKIGAPEQEIEVEYKEFTVSEFMEIRKKRQNFCRKGTEKVLIEGADKKGGDRRNNGVAGVAAARMSPEREDRRGRFFIAVLVLLILAVIAGVYYLLRFLYHR